VKSSEALLQDGDVVMKRSAATGSISPGLMPFWFWNEGGDAAAKIAYLKRCREEGFEQLLIHPRSGNRIPYGGKDWFDLVRQVVAAGAKLGMRLWLYDEDPYPSGAAGGLVMSRHPELRADAMSLRSKPAGVKRGQPWVIGLDRVLWAGLVPKKGNGEAIDLTSSVGVLRQDWFLGDWHSRYYYPDTPITACPRGDAIRTQYALTVPAMPRGYELQAIVLVPCGAEGSWGCLPDCLNPATYEAFQRYGLDPYVRAVGRYFGRTIPGIFTDEAKPHGAFPYTADLLPAMKAAGWDLRTRLPLLLNPCDHTEASEMRIAYREWIGRRFLEAFLRPYRRWCDRRYADYEGAVSARHRHDCAVCREFVCALPQPWQSSCRFSQSPAGETLCSQRINGSDDVDCHQ
jgi:hypothetical protein